MASGRISTIRRALALTAALGMGVGSFVTPAGAADGDRDTTFGTNGVATLPPIFSFGGSTQAGDMALDGQGRMVVAVARRGLAAILRYTPTGQLDGTFGDFGVLRVPTANGCTGKLALLADGRIRWAVGLPSGTATRVYAYGPDAKALDASFGNGGTRDVPIACPTAFALSGARHYLSGARKIVAIKGSGAIDTAFAATGALTMPADITDLEVAPDGDIVVGFGPANGRVRRYNAQGTPDAGFAAGGALAVDPAPELAVTGTGRIVVAGSMAMPCGRTTLVRRFLGSGAVDTGWAMNFVAECNGDAGDVVVTSTREVVIGGTAGDLRRYGSDGAFLGSFGTAARHVVLDADGNGGVFGLSTTGGGTEPTVVTATGYGAPAPTYTRRIDVAWPADAVPRIVTARSGKVTVVMDARFPDGAGGAPQVTRPDFLGRLTSAGALDRTFDGDGIADPFSGGGRARIGALRAEANGYRVAVHKGSFYGLARVRPDGSLVEPLTMIDHIEDRVLASGIDSTGRALFFFDYGGLHRVNADGTNDDGYNDAIVPPLQGLVEPTLVMRHDDRALVFDGSGTIVALQEGGLADPTFGGGDGVVSVGAGRSDFVFLADATTDAQGRITVTYITNTLTGKVVRLKADGTPDNSFTATSLPFAPRRMVADPSGRLVVAGGPAFGSGPVSVARVRVNGSLDPRFGTGGTVSIRGAVRAGDVRLAATDAAVHVASPNRIVKLTATPR